MKKVNLLFLLIYLTGGLLVAQEPVTLEKCQQWARENHPVLRQSALYQQMLELKNDNVASVNLPQLTLNGQATYQSDFTRIGNSLHKIHIPQVDKDQYKIYVDLRQTIWDGGLSKARELINESENAGNQQQVEVELYQLKENVNRFFFTSFLIQENLQILDQKTAVLAERRKMMESAVKNGMMLSSELDQLLADLIKTDQMILELKSSKETVLSALAIVTGKPADQLQPLELNNIDNQGEPSLIRPELELFARQLALLDANAEMLKKQRNPKVFGFGQAGYGKPGLNMLNNEFDTYYLVGLGFNWNVLDWKNTARQRQVLKLQQEIVQTKQASFVRNIDLAAEQQKNKPALTNLLKQIKNSNNIGELVIAGDLMVKRHRVGSIRSAEHVQRLHRQWRLIDHLRQRRGGGACLVQPVAAVTGGDIMGSRAQRGGAVGCHTRAGIDRHRAAQRYGIGVELHRAARGCR